MWSLHHTITFRFRNRSHSSLQTPDADGLYNAPMKETPDTNDAIVSTGVRSVIGGFLMGLANLVPGISGGTMLLASGVYPQFISAVSDITTFRWRLRSLIIIACIGISAVVAIALLAGVVTGLIISHQWIMYSIFIGLTLGGVPIILRLLRPISTKAMIAAAIGCACMIILAMAEMLGAEGASENLSGHTALLFAGGVTAGAAMVLPGVSGSYLLLILGQYLLIFDAVNDAKLGLKNADTEAMMAAAKILLPAVVGAVIGIVVVSNVLKRLLERAPQITLGALMGLLIGAVVGLWPFQARIEPQIGDTTAWGQVITNEQQLAELEPKNWATEFFSPSPGLIIGALCLIGIGFAISMAIGWAGTVLDQQSKRSAAINE